jgi:hypothetical protein
MVRRATRGWLATAGIAGLGIAVIAWLLYHEPTRRTEFGLGSSRNPASDGASVAARLLADRGIEVIELTHPVDFAALSPRATVLRLSVRPVDEAESDAGEGAAKTEPECAPGAG